MDSLTSERAADWIVSLVADGETFDDDDLRRLIDAAHGALRIRGEQRTLTLKPGARVRSADGIGPKYLLNRTGTFIRREGQRLIVNWDAHQHHYDRRGRDRLRGDWQMTPGSIVPFDQTIEDEAA